MADSRANALCLLHILQEHSDEEHILSTAEIIKYFQSEYEKKVDRRTIYAAISTLKELKYNVLDYEDTGEGYYLAENVFTQEEVRLLIDAVFNCEYISSRQTEKLLEKIRGFLSEHERSKYNYSKMVKTNYKTPNLQVYYNIAALTRAISEKRKIAFTYMDYDYDKKLKPRRDEKDVGSPLTMTCDSGHYYVAAITERHKDVTYYRVDMMKDIEVLTERIAISKREAGLDTDRRVVYAFAGTPVAIQLHCKKTALRYVIERFGNDITIKKNDDGSFEAYFSAAPGGVKLWALQNLQNAEVTAPVSLRNEIADIIRGCAYLNEND